MAGMKHGVETVDRLYRWRWILVVFHAAACIPITVWLLGCVPNLVWKYQIWRTGQWLWEPIDDFRRPLEGVFGVFCGPYNDPWPPSSVAMFPLFTNWFYVAWTLCFAALVLVPGIYFLLAFPQKPVIQGQENIWRWPMAIAFSTPKALLTFGVIGFAIVFVVPFLFVPGSRGHPGFGEANIDDFLEHSTKLFLSVICFSILTLCWWFWAWWLRHHRSQSYVFRSCIETLAVTMGMAVILCLASNVYPDYESGFRVVVINNCLILSLTAAWWTVGCLGYLLFRWPAFREAERSPVMVCQSCGYDLRGSPGACPECGAARPVVSE